MAAERREIVITGMGALTPIGVGVKAYWEGLIHAHCGIQRLTHIDTEGLPVQIGGEVPPVTLDRALAGKMARFTQFAYLAAKEAMEDSCLTPDPFRTGLTMGTAMDGVLEICQTQEAFTKTGRRVSPFFVPKVLGNMAACQIAMSWDIQGPSYTVNTACASGADAITLAVMLLRSGQADAVLAVGGESMACAPVISSLASAQALSRRNDDPLHASRPFDRDRDGFVMGEGGGALVLETEAHARARGAHIYARLLGCGNTSDAYHLTSPRPHGEGGARCMALALADAGLVPEQIGYLNAHGTATHVGDVCECQAIRIVFGDHAEALPVSSTKGATGHMMGAGGITEVIACVQAIRQGILPPTLNLEHPDPDCQVCHIPNTPREAHIDAAMSNAMGFGGQNGTIIVGRY